MEEMSIKRVTKGLMILLLVGPSFVWAAAVGLFIVMPKMLSKESYAVLRPSRIFGVGLLVTFFVFGYICITQIPSTLAQLFGGSG